jgi:hypothetical protein
LIIIIIVVVVIIIIIIIMVAVVAEEKKMSYGLQSGGKEGRVRMRRQKVLACVQKKMLA